ncbi:MAG TPA: SET domain-containing protein-lysine N-methyltransferase [Elusimicrobiota bacterium]|jgi:SET domain-containing protein|nr:SET domain-containing protein-lysine N-methyltransferase [Elusimicrobiota bacterium]HNI56669.1 SET domain-containing protein-lysine N-methyltransferase [Elusimicrobiota bacterium]
MRRSPPPKRTNNEWVFAAPSGIHGSGLFARAEIPAGTLLVEYDGPRVSAAEGRRRAAEGNAFVFGLNRREFIDGSVGWNLGRFANHSCEPNAASESRGGRIWLRALRVIFPKEEITYDYGFSFRDDPTPCRCGAPNCRGNIVAARHRDRS